MSLGTIYHEGTGGRASSTHWGEFSHRISKRACVRRAVLTSKTDFRASCEHGFVCDTGCSFRERIMTPRARLAFCRHALEQVRRRVQKLVEVVIDMVVSSRSFSRRRWDENACMLAPLTIDVVPSDKGSTRPSCTAKGRRLKHTILIYHPQGDSCIWPTVAVSSFGCTANNGRSRRSQGFDR